MTGFVIDAATVLSWCFEDEDGPEANTLIDQVAAEGAAVPSLWSLEIANGLVMGERRGRDQPAESAVFIAMIEDLPIVTDFVNGRPSTARDHGSRTRARANGL